MNQARGYGRRWARVERAFLAMLLVGVAAACSRGDAAPQGTLIAVREKDFKLTTTVEQVKAGLVTFRVTNAGPSAHEFIVDRSDVVADALPLQKNGLTVNEDSKQLHEVGALGDLRLGSTHDLTLTLTPGSYVLFCNLDGHYRGGMYAPIQVTG